MGKPQSVGSAAPDSSAGRLRMTNAAPLQAIEALVTASVEPTCHSRYEAPCHCEATAEATSGKSLRRPSRAQFGQDHTEVPKRRRSLRRGVRSKIASAVASQ